jgi:hypothetical protein
MKKFRKQEVNVHKNYLWNKSTRENNTNIDVTEIVLKSWPSFNT